MVFTGIATLPKRCRNGDIVRDSEGNVVFDKRPHLKTEPDIKFLKITG